MRKSSDRTHNFPSTPSRHAELVASFREQMADYARGEHLKALREGRRLSQEGAAHEIGVSTKTIRTWEKGGKIKWANAKSAASFYEVDPETLVSRDEEESEAPVPAAEPDDRLSLAETKLNEALELLHAHIAQTGTRAAEADQAVEGDDGRPGQDEAQGL